MAHLIKPCSMKGLSKTNGLNLPAISPRCFPPPIGLVGKNGKATIPTKTRNGDRREKTGTHLMPSLERIRAVEGAAFMAMDCRDVPRELKSMRMEAEK